MKTKRGQALLIIITVIIILLILGGVGFYFYLSNVKTQSAIQSTCSLSNQGSKTNSYTCPTGKSCEATVKLDCNSLSSNSKVSMRMEDFNFNSGWIAYDNTYGGLDSYVYNKIAYVNNSNQIGTKDSASSQLFIKDIYISREYGEINIFTGNIKHYAGASGNCRWNSLPTCPSIPTGAINVVQSIQSCSPSQWTKCVIDYDMREFIVYNIGSGANINPNPTNNCQLPEICGGSAYSCSQQITGSYQKTVVYNSQSPGSKTEKTTLSPGQVINWNGVINYAETETQNSECQVGVYIADATVPNKYYSCIQDSNGCGKKGGALYCDGSNVFSQDAQKCQAPYDVDINLDKTIFSTQEDITGNIKLKGMDQVSGIPVTVTLIDSLGKTVAGETFTSNTNSRGEFPYGFDLPKVNSNGNYKVRVTVNHQSLGQLIKDKSITIANTILVTLSTGTGTIQYTAEPITIIADTTNSDGTPKDIDSFDFTGTTCNNKDIDPDKIAITRVSRGHYKLSTKINEECTMTWTAVAVSSGFRSDPYSVNVDVQGAEMIIKPDLTNAQDKEVGTYTIKFKTFNTALQPISSDNSIVITNPNACKTGEYCYSTGKSIPSVVVTETKGDYQFNYNFDSAGQYQIDFTSSSSGLLQNTLSSSVNIFPCSSSVCNSQDTSDNTTGISTGFILTAVVIVVALGLFFWLIFRKGKRR